MKYPNGAKNQIDNSVVNDTKATMFANRGMDFEKSVSLSASYYLEQDLAVIYKRPTPIHVVKLLTHILKNNRQLIITVFIKEDILILNAKKPNQLPRYHFIIFLLSKSNI